MFSRGVWPQASQQAVLNGSRGSHRDESSLLKSSRGLLSSYTRRDAVRTSSIVLVSHTLQGSWATNSLGFDRKGNLRVRVLGMPPRGIAYTAVPTVAGVDSNSAVPFYVGTSLKVMPGGGAARDG